MDIIYINSETILDTVYRSIIFKACVPLPSRYDEEIYRGSDLVLCLHHKGGYTVKKTHADGEFESLLFKIREELDIDVNIANPDEHVRDIERLDRAILKMFRTKYYRLPFKVIPKVMVNSLACTTTWEMNLFPVKGGVSNYFSPHVILDKK